MTIPTRQNFSVTKRQGAYLPHWTAEGAIYSVTFRLADSLPHSVVQAYREERDRLLAASRQEMGGVEFTPGDARRLQELFSERIEKFLDAGHGACWMNRPKVADCVQDAILFFHGERYQLAAWAVMPNHVHVVFQPAIAFDLSSILHSWKSFTAKKANKLLGRTGAFRQVESYDHLIRDDQDLLHCMDYTLRNPMVAGLKGWRWVGIPKEHRRDADATKLPAPPNAPP